MPRRHVKALSRDEFEMKKLMKIGKCRLAAAPRPLVKQAARAIQTEPCPKVSVYACVGSAVSEGRDGRVHAPHGDDVGI